MPRPRALRGVASNGGAKNPYRMQPAPTLSVNETFVSIQGEGDFIGTPAFFIRLDGCPLRCTWCDTPYALAGDAGTAYDVAALAAKAGDHRRIIITGGEPLAQDLRPLLAFLRGRHVTIETSGTIFADFPDVSLFSISPKVGSSGYKPKPHILRRFFASAPGRLQLKFVIAGDGDTREVRDLLAGLRADLPAGTPVVLQPESGAAGSGDAYARFLRALTERVLADEFWKGYDVRVLPQLHYLLWNGEAGR
jgi:7-carboxy-7-deazaguanine synthase